ncbi:unnamed protein product [Cochlearia groenlandica]
MSKPNLCPIVFLGSSALLLDVMNDCLVPHCVHASLALLSFGYAPYASLTPMGSPFQLAARETKLQLTFDTLTLGTTSRKTRARLLRFWMSGAFSGCNPFNGITLTFVDIKGSLITGLLPAPQVANFLALLEENTVYNFAHFEVEKCQTLYKTSEHPYVIRFLDQTILEPVMENVYVIPTQQFMVRTCDQLHMLANTNLELPDVFGIIKSVKSYGLDIPGVLAPESRPGVSLTGSCCLGFQAASEFHCQAALCNPVHKCQPKLNPFTCHNFGHDQMHALSILNVGAKVNASQICPIGDLNTFLSNTEFKEPLLSCKARIVDIVHNNGWFAVCCGECEQPLPCSAAKKECTQTSPHMRICVVRYKVELLVDDGHNYAVFVVGDKDMVRHVDADMLPPVLDQLRGCDFVFHVLQTNGSTTHTSPFTVVGISEVVRHDHGPALPQNLVEEEA